MHCFFCKKPIRFWQTKVNMDCLDNPLIYGYAHNDCFVGHHADILDNLRCEVSHIKFVVGDKLGIEWDIGKKKEDEAP